MNEATLKQDLVYQMKEVIKRGLTVRHEDVFRAGIPDISHTSNKRTTWLEVKYVNPRFRSNNIQKYTCWKLAEYGICWYVIYDDRPNRHQTLIVHPSRVWDDDWDAATERFKGFDHKAVARFVQRGHAQ